MALTQHGLIPDEEAQLDDLASRSAFWAKVRSGYARYDALTYRQYELFTRELEKNAWRNDAPVIGSSPVRNKYRTADGHPRCAHRAKPRCQAQATVVVGVMGYCETHFLAAVDERDKWLAENAKPATVTPP